MVIPESIKKLIDQFTKLPGVGPRQAARFVFWLINSSKEQQGDFIRSFQELQKIKICPQCNFISTDTLCSICSSPLRQKSQLAVVERATDLLSLERSGHYKGLYFILGGNIYSNKNLNLEPLKTRVSELKNQSPAQLEIILALNPTTEGEATALFIEKELTHSTSSGSALSRTEALKNLPVKISRLARGLPSGADLEYADAQTLQQAFEGRKTHTS